MITRPGGGIAWIGWTGTGPAPGKLVIERAVDRYIVRERTRGGYREVYDCRTLTQLYAWLDHHGIALGELVDVDPGLGDGSGWEPGAA